MGNCSRAFAIFPNESKFQTVEIFEPCVRNLDPRKFEIRNIYGTKISQITVMFIHVHVTQVVVQCSKTARPLPNLLHELRVVLP